MTGQTIPLRLLPQEVTYVPVGVYGDPTGPAVTVRARVTWSDTLVQSGTGAVSVAKASVVLAPGAVPAIGDDVTMPGGESRVVVSVREQVGRRVVHHVEVEVG